MKYKLRTKLSIFFVLVAVVSFSLISILTNIFVDRHFREYVKRNQEQKHRGIINSITQQYMGDGIWNLDIIDTVGVNSLESGFIIKVKDGSGNLLWDATSHNEGMCQRIVEQMYKNMNARYPNIEGGYIEKPYPVLYQSNIVGIVEIGSYGPFYLNDHDVEFINTLNSVILGVGVFCLLFALLLGQIISRRISTPITRVIDTAQLISKGYYSDRVKEKSNTIEICQLTDTINNLAKTLESQEVLRKRLTSDVAHELRTPLATLQSHMEAMIDGIWELDPKRLKSCHEEIIRLNKMVGDLEKLAKYESEMLVLSKVCFDVTDLVRRIVYNFEPEFKDKGVEINFSGEEESIIADRDKMSQVIINLISNALKYTPKGGTVSINAIGGKDVTKISIKDNGMGIPERDLPFIFERFYRADKSRNRLTGGSGIGLTIAKTIVESHKGHIEVYSKEGEGTEFIISLPKG